MEARGLPFQGPREFLPGQQLRASSLHQQGRRAPLRARKHTELIRGLLAAGCTASVAEGSTGTWHCRAVTGQEHLVAPRRFSAGCADGTIGAVRVVPVASGGEHKAAFRASTGSARDTADAPAPLLHRSNLVRNLKLSLSGRCNLACENCFRHPGIPEIHDPQIPMRAIDAVVHGFSCDAPSYFISFNPTLEPFLQWRLLETLMAHSGGTFIALQAAARAHSRHGRPPRVLLLHGPRRLHARAGGLDDALHAVGPDRVLLPSLRCRAYTLRERLNIWRGRADLADRN